MMKKVAVAAKVPAAPGKGAELAAALQFALDNVVSENGTLLYILHADAKMAPLMGGRPELIFLTPIAGKGL